MGSIIFVDSLKAFSKGPVLRVEREYVLVAQIWKGQPRMVIWIVLSDDIGYVLQQCKRMTSSIRVVCLPVSQVYCC